MSADHRRRNPDPVSGDAAKADQVLAGTAGTVTFGKLRAAAHRLVLDLDPDAAAEAEGGGPA